MILRDMLTIIALQSGAIIYRRFDGSIGVTSLDEPESVSRNIENADILLDGNGLAQWNYGYSNAKYLITKININYCPLIPVKDNYTKKKYCYRTGFIDPAGVANYNIGEGDTYSGYLQNAYDILGEERELSIKCPGIRDDDTAENLLKLIIKWRSALLRIITLACKYTILDIEIGDDIGITATVLPSYLASKKWFVTGTRIMPLLRGNTMGVKLTLIETGGSQIAEDEVWQKTPDTGDEKTFTADTGEIKQFIP